jgi:hypothetical protein
MGQDYLDLAEYIINGVNMGKKKKKVVFDKEKSDLYGSARIKIGRKGEVFKDKSKYSRKKKHRKTF